MSCAVAGCIDPRWGSGLITDGDVPSYSLLDESARAAIEAVARQQNGLPLTTARVLVALHHVDQDAAGWARISLTCPRAEHIDPDDWPDDSVTSSESVDDVPFSEELEDALRIAARIGQHYGLIPVPTFVLVLGLVARRNAGATRALLEGTDCPHAGLIDLVQDCLGSGRLESLDLTSASVPSVFTAPPSGGFSKPRPSLRQRWDWIRVRSVLLAVGLPAYAIILLAETAQVGREKGAHIAALYVVLAAVCAFFGLRSLRRATDSTAVTQRRERALAQVRQHAAAHQRDAVGTSFSLACEPKAAEILRNAADEEPLTVTTRRHVVASLETYFGAEPPLRDDPSLVHVVIDSGGEARVLLASPQLASCLADAGRLSRAFGEPVACTHISAAIAFSMADNADSVYATMVRYFGPDAPRAIDALHSTVPSEGKPKPNPVKFLPKARQRARRSELQQRALRAGYVIGGVVLLIPVGQLYSEIPKRFDETSMAQAAQSALRDGRNGQSYRLFSELVEREPTSTFAQQGRACAAARIDGLDRWAWAEDLAIAAGMPARWAGACLPPGAARTVHIQMAEGMAIIVPQRPPSGTTPDRGSALVITPAPKGKLLVDVAADTSCLSGKQGLTLYAAQQAGLSLNVLKHSPTDASQVVGKLKRCVREWPKDKWRKLVVDWLSDS